MAGPLSSEEIEDVVSSVRRLVSNELATRRPTRDLAAERLLLTPSLRVVTEASPLAPLILHAAAPAPEPVAEPVPEVIPEPEALAPAPEDESVDLIDAEWEDEIWSASEAVSLGEVALGADEAEVLPGPDADEAGFVDGLEDEAASWAQPDWAEAEPVPFIPLRRRAEHLAARLAAGGVRDPEDQDEPELKAPSAEETAETAAALPDAIPDAAEGPSQDDAVSGDTAAYVLDDAVLQDDDPADDDLLPDPHDAVPQRMPTEILDADGTPLAVLDEAALQEIVRQMIREELQGALGERITRNVRKLVRAEINRALVARDLD